MNNKIEYTTELWNGVKVTEEEVKEWVEKCFTIPDKEYRILSGDTVVFKLSDGTVLEAKITNAYNLKEG